MAQAPDRMKALEAALGQIDRQFGKGSAMRMGDSERRTVAVIPTGSIALDIALGIGGLPRGRVVEIYGPESSGKTTVALHAVANAQKAGGVAAFIDAEHALDPEYARKLGVDIDNLIISQPDTGEQALEIADILIRSGGIDVLVIDSVAALVPKAEIEGEMGDSHVGLQARLMSQALRKITGAIANTGTTAIFINQLREKIGVFFGSPETTTGGKALKFYASVRLDIRRIETLKEGNEPVGNRTRVKVVKNKMAPPFKQAEFDILYGHGISVEGGIIDLGVEHGFVKKSGAWYTYESDQLGQGKENARQFLKDNPALAVEIETKIKTKLNIGPAVAVEEAEAPAKGKKVASADIDTAAVGDAAREAAMAKEASSLEEAQLRVRTTRARQESSTTDPAERARALAISMLDRTQLSSADLRARLIAKEADPAVADAIVERYLEVGLLDDKSLAAMIARTRQIERGHAPRVIEAELRRKGFAEVDIESALEHMTVEVQLEAARALAESRWERMSGLNSDVRVRRLTAFLGRKGYPASMVFGLVRDLIRADSEVAGP